MRQRTALGAHLPPARTFAEAIGFAGWELPPEEPVTSFNYMPVGSGSISAGSDSTCDHGVSLSDSGSVSADCASLLGDEPDQLGSVVSPGRLGIPAPAGRAPVPIEDEDPDYAPPSPPNSPGTSGNEAGPSINMSTLVKFPDVHDSPTTDTVDFGRIVWLRLATPRPVVHQSG
ncbi:hypothetical protein CYMTET_56162 [Cymbomonas tetramitiformis]|uniref:Uncharacterized protein n=1 Tax=Cymbomonas tetramitiformis TaxID=36881 RepID=A0AAE0BBU9_9CHLO|nr:hypothetical protein CYMTET_56162 [Cymbomonas tetramitiformis]